MDGPLTSSTTHVKSETPGRQMTLSEHNRKGEAMNQARYDYKKSAIAKWVTTNNSPNNIVDMPCAAQSALNYRSTKPAKSGLGLDPILAKCRKVVRHFKQCSVNSAELKNYQLQLYQRHDMLIQDVRLAGILLFK